MENLNFEKHDQPIRNMPDVMPIKYQREDVPSLSDTEYARLGELVDAFPTFHESDPRYEEWEGLQRKADKAVSGE